MKLSQQLKFWLIIGVFGACVTSCTDKPTIDPLLTPIINPDGGLYILNEGNFQSANASIDYIDFKSQQYFSNAFEAKNSRPLGDVLQSMSHMGNNGYLVINNSKKIEVVNMSDLSSIATIEGFKSPRYFYALNPQKAYVTEYYNGGIKLVNLTSNTIAGTIPVEGNLEEMLNVDGKLYVTNANKRFLYIINTISDVVMDSIALPFGSNSIVRDFNKKLWVLCSGKDGAVPEFGALVKINAEADTIEQIFTLPRESGHGPIKLRIDAAGRTLYWINRHIYRHQVISAQLNLAPWIDAYTNTNYWALRCDSLTNEVYVADAIDYMQRSLIQRYNSNGELKGFFKAGTITGDFYFYYR
ncbi:MAG: hypothetical protein MUC81_07940 [Bacteroidia bacterium]|jgi:hypothetical protein|nr:hypothetical protein [Bacteroidia bacterium]